MKVEGTRERTIITTGMLNVVTGTMAEIETATETVTETLVVNEGVRAEIDSENLLLGETSNRQGGVEDHEIAAMIWCPLHHPLHRHRLMDRKREEEPDLAQDLGRVHAEEVMRGVMVHAVVAEKVTCHQESMAEAKKGLHMAVDPEAEGREWRARARGRDEVLDHSYIRSQETEFSH